MTAALAAEVVGTFMLTFAGTATVLATVALHPGAHFSVADDLLIGLGFALGSPGPTSTLRSRLDSPPSAGSPGGWFRAMSWPSSPGASWPG